MSRSGSQKILEHRYECAGRAVSRLKSNARDFQSLRQKSQAIDQSQLLFPPAKRHVNFLPEQSLNGSLARAGLSADLLGSQWIRGIGKKQVGDLLGSRIDWLGKLKRKEF
jgi:hypothetical protein